MKIFVVYIFFFKSCIICVSYVVLCNCRDAAWCKEGFCTWSKSLQSDLFNSLFSKDI